MRYTFQLGGQPHSITLEKRPDGSFQAIIEDRAYEVQAQIIATGKWRLRINGKTHIIHTCAHGDHRYVQVAGTDLVFSQIDLRSPGRQSRLAVDALTAQMPGQVTSVLVKAGDQVIRGQTLLTLEAMKMETRFTAPANGYVKSIQVHVGDVVDRGQQLADFEPEPAVQSG